MARIISLRPGFRDLPPPPPVLIGFEVCDEDGRLPPWVPPASLFDARSWKLAAFTPAAAARLRPDGAHSLRDHVVWLGVTRGIETAVSLFEAAILDSMMTPPPAAPATIEIPEPSRRKALRALGVELNREQAADYCDVAPGTFDRHFRPRLVPVPKGTREYWRAEDLDALLEPGDPDPTPMAEPVGRKPNNLTSPEQQRVLGELRARKRKRTQKDHS